LFFVRYRGRSRGKNAEGGIKPVPTRKAGGPGNPFGFAQGRRDDNSGEGAQPGMAVPQVGPGEARGARSSFKSSIKSAREI